MTSPLVMTLPQAFAASMTISSSSGLMVQMLMTRAWIPFSASVYAAMSASLTIRPVAIIATSLPSVSVSPLPISK